MDIYSFPPIAFVIDIAYSIVSALADLLEPFAGSASAAFAVVLITLLVRAALTPVGVSLVRADFTRRRLAPKIAELQRRYKAKPETLQRKMMELYAEEKASPMAGCLPMLAQAPVVGTIYALFILTTINGHPNALLTQEFFGVPLGTSFAHLLTTGGLTVTSAILFAVIMVVIVVVAQASRRLLTQSAPAPAARPDGAPDLSGLVRVLSFAPFLTAIFAGIVPLAAALYLTVTVTWTLGERLILRRVLGRKLESGGTAPATA